MIQGAVAARAAWIAVFSSAVGAGPDLLVHWSVHQLLELACGSPGRVAP